MMPSNILVTGAAGYIGGSLIADLLANDSTSLSEDNISVVVRSNEQADALSTLGVNVLRFSLTDEQAALEAVIKHKINIIVHTASAIDPGLALPLLKALGKQKAATGNETYFIHTSGLSAFFQNTGWPDKVMKDTDPIFDTEKQLEDSFPIRKTDVTIVEHAKALGVTSFVVVPSVVYGKGSGPWNKLSVVIPVVVQAALKKKVVNKFAGPQKTSAVHITDLTALYINIIESIVKRKSISHDTEGYYMAIAHDFHWWQALDRLAVAMHARGLISDSKTEIWPSDEVAAEALGIPAAFVQALWNSGEKIVAERPATIGWKPKWDNDRFLQEIDDEVDAVLEEKEAKSSLLDSLRNTGR